MWRGRAGALRILPTYLTKKNRRARRAPTADVRTAVQKKRDRERQLVRLAYTYTLWNPISGLTWAHTITPSHHHTTRTRTQHATCACVAWRTEMKEYSTRHSDSHLCCILLLLVAHVRWHPPRGHSEAATAGPHIPSHDKPRRGDGIYRRRAKDQGPRQETASDVRDCHLDERELELQPLAGRHEELSAAILGGDLHAWLGLGLGSGSGLGISTPGRRRRGAGRRRVA